MLKKQTVWLLTMLSLMIVLSVYYMSSPSEGELAFINDEADTEGEITTGNITEETSEETTSDDGVSSEDITSTSDESEISSTSTDDLFTTIRMELEETRSGRLEQLENIVASSAASTEEKTQAYDEMQELDSISSKELILEETLKADNGYTDVLVRTKDDNIIVTVKADELSETEANGIMQMVHDEFGSMNVEVKFQPNS
ncbi:SpoIIIAH-like family protein [Paraliobacillus sediminis]|uniref:SpoIIIAH-like family protein n=1 Tax=Paraliobacillus sediminis TaxID=1885916 RepID=UPI000E3E8C3A|nr:SpoIIIAH-like family protein [Paraliobacillus sediminis]